MARLIPDRSILADIGNGEGGHIVSRRSLLQFAVALTLSASYGRRAFAAANGKKLAKRLIVLDPGHGGIDPGCIGYAGTFEKDITSATVIETARILESSGHYAVLVTHRTDRFVPLAERVSIARKAKADLFLSVHADSLPQEALRGASIFTLSQTASDNLAAAVAKQENSVDLLAGIRFQGQSTTVNDILLDLLQRETRNLSLTFAHALHLGLGKKIAMLPNSERAANFAVLRSPEIPSSLVEIGCLSNRSEERELVRPSYQRQIALALSHSIDMYFSQVT